MNKENREAMREKRWIIPNQLDYPGLLVAIDRNPIQRN